MGWAYKQVQYKVEAGLTLSFRCSRRSSASNSLVSLRRLRSATVGVPLGGRDVAKGRSTGPWAGTLGLPRAPQGAHLIRNGPGNWLIVIGEEPVPG
jgi:hypothetical protein